MWPPRLDLATAVFGLFIGVSLISAVFLIASSWRSLPVKRILQHEPTDTEPAVTPIALFTTDEIKQRVVTCGRPECAQTASQSCSHYLALLSYLEEFLARPHASVGRAGPVCPFVPLALKKLTLLVGMVRTQTASFSVDDVVKLMRHQRDHFLAMEPTSGRLKLYKAIVIGFPDISDEDAPRIIDRVQRQLKVEFTQSGMMIGEFHRLNKTPGLRNSAFCPLQTSIAALAIRFMVPTDVLFLKHEAEYLKAYLATIPDTQSNTAYRAEAQQAMEDLRDRA